VGYGVDEAVVLLVAANLADQEDCIPDQAGDQDGEEDNAKHQRHNLAPVDDPGDIEDKRGRDHACTKHDRERHCLFSTGDLHAETERPAEILLLRA